MVEQWRRRENQGVRWTYDGLEVLMASSHFRSNGSYAAKLNLTVFKEKC